MNAHSLAKNIVTGAAAFAFVVSSINPASAEDPAAKTSEPAGITIKEYCNMGSTNGPAYAVDYLRYLRDVRLAPKAGDNLAERHADMRNFVIAMLKNGDLVDKFTKTLYQMHDAGDDNKQVKECILIFINQEFPIYLAAHPRR
jgi:hypothetical protein